MQSSPAQYAGYAASPFRPAALTPSQVDTLAKQTSQDPNDALLVHLRALERKMGLVLTLVRRVVSPV